MAEIMVQPNFRHGYMDAQNGMATIPAMPKRGPYGTKAPLAKLKPLPRRITPAKRWRLKLGYTQEEAAEGAGVSTGNISAIESGRQDYKQHSLEKLADFYKIPAGWLISIDPDTDDLWLLLRKATKLQRGTISDFAKRILNPKD